MRRELLSVTHEYDASPEEMWPVFADLVGYAKHVDDLRSTNVLQGAGLGAVRECVTTKDERWKEDVSVWKPFETYEVEVRTDTYPLPLKQIFRRFTGVWTIEPVSGGGSKATIRFIADVRGGWPAVQLLRLGMGSHRANLIRTLESYGNAVRQGA